MYVLATNDSSDLKEPQGLSPKVILILSLTLASIVLLAIVMGIIHCIRKRRNRRVVAQNLPLPPVSYRPAEVAVDRTPPIPPKSPFRPRNPTVPEITTMPNIPQGLSYEQAYTQPRPLQDVYLPRHYATVGHGHERNVHRESDYNFSRPWGSVGHAHGRNIGHENMVSMRSPVQSYDAGNRRTLYWL
ncbi:hypothetical protein K491DRAFT_721428 [Lophiostoma macrostomum CBS 122681]|uniref:Uncharacterized protein n=1 Tax=Lophiostoma macrostomum CBS 122681 TaxID=1314788 RepID=A0A6A6SP98_9PLEO|nr:hypothetical protein K491DRAFT_721428 [Lophiostoma macrostomum CBS 122681]